MKIPKALALLFATWLVEAAGVNAAPKSHVACKHKLQRKAWHTLKKHEKRAYLDAEKCLMKLPAQLGHPGTRTRFDELQAAHAMGAEWTHEVGGFLPFHRLMMHTHEYLLRTECGYKGAQPYWYEPRDAGRVTQSSILDPILGFGGDGAGPLNCIQDGPFVGYVNGIGPFYAINDHCIDRKLNNEASWWMSQGFINYCYQFQDYATAWWCIKGGPHFGGHAAIGLEMANPISSPGDPIFYLHHTWLDKVWWDWQALDLPTRLYDISGTNEQDPCRVFEAEGFQSMPPGPHETLPFPPWPNGTVSFEPLPNGSIPFPGIAGGIFPPPAGCVNGTNTWSPSPFPKNPGDPGKETTLGHVLSMFGIISNKTVADVMDIGNNLLCYEYV